VLAWIQLYYLFFLFLLKILYLEQLMQLNNFFFLEKTSTDQRKKNIKPSASFAKEFDDYITTLKNLVL